MVEAAAPGGEFATPDGIRVVSAAGEGERSQWFRAEQVRLERFIALKRLRRPLAENPRFLEAFLEAGRQAATMVHPSALPIINVFPRHQCIAVQWCRGTPLKNLTGKLEPLRAALVGEAVLDCLSSLHATGRCHGNIIPGNVFLGDAGGVWLDDFFQPPVMTAAGETFVGERRFLAPECLSASVMDWRTDIFSLGCVLDEVMAGERPRELAGVVEAMRALDPNRRGESPQAVLTALRRFRQQEEARKGLEQASGRRKRMYRRVPAEFDVSLRRRSATPGETAVILMKIRDIGESGVFVETNDDLIGVGSILELDFTLKGAGGQVHAFGVVRWKSAPPMPKGVGVQFMEVDQAGLARLRKFLENR